MADPLYRIYFDSNDGPDMERYGLWGHGSLEDIAPISDKLVDGMRVIIYMTDELEMEATLLFDPKFQAWTAIPDWKTVVYADRRA